MIFNVFTDDWVLQYSYVILTVYSCSHKLCIALYFVFVYRFEMLSISLEHQVTELQTNLLAARNQLQLDSVLFVCAYSLLFMSCSRLFTLLV